MKGSKQAVIKHLEEYFTKNKKQAFSSKTLKLTKELIISLRSDEIRVDISANPSVNMVVIYLVKSKDDYNQFDFRIMIRNGKYYQTTILLTNLKNKIENKIICGPVSGFFQTGKVLKYKYFHSR